MKLRQTKRAEGSGLNNQQDGGPLTLNVIPSTGQGNPFDKLRASSIIIQFTTLRWPTIILNPGFLLSFSRCEHKKVHFLQEQGAGEEETLKLG